MTGYGKAEVELKNNIFNIEIRTLNSKQLDINMRIPQVFKAKEIALRTMISKQLQRGKVDFSINSNNQKQNSPLKLNTSVAKQYFTELQKLSEELGQNSNDLLSVISRLPDVFIAEEDQLNDNDWQILQTAAEEAITNVNTFRAGEGVILEKDFRLRINKILNFLLEVPKYEAARITRVRERIEKSMKENFSNVQYDKNRLEQEIIFYIEKLDITEEKVRLKKHCDYFLEVLNSENTVGKKLAFVTQEIGREINTLGSKANDASLQKLVVLMKDELEKIKEQMLNIL